MERVGKVAYVAEVAEHLSKADFVTRTESTVDGGMGRKMMYPEYEFEIWKREKNREYDGNSAQINLF